MTIVVTGSLRVNSKKMGRKPRLTLSEKINSVKLKLNNGDVCCCLRGCFRGFVLYTLTYCYIMWACLAL